MSASSRSDESNNSGVSAVTDTASSSWSFRRDGGGNDTTTTLLFTETCLVQIGVREASKTDHETRTSDRERRSARIVEWPQTCFGNQSTISNLDKVDGKREEECALRRINRGAIATKKILAGNGNNGNAAAATEEVLSCCEWTEPRGTEIPTSASKPKSIIRTTTTRRQLTRQEGGSVERLGRANGTEAASADDDRCCAVAFATGKKWKSGETLPVGNSSADEVSLWSCDFSDCTVTAAESDESASTYAVFALTENGRSRGRESKLISEEGLFPVDRMPLKTPSPSPPSTDYASSASRQTVDTVNECIVRIDDAERSDSGCVLSGIWFANGKDLTGSTLYEEELQKKKKQPEEVKDERVVWGLDDRVDYSNDRNEALSRWSLGSEEYFANERRERKKMWDVVAAASPEKKRSEDTTPSKLPPLPLPQSPTTTKPASKEEEPVTMVWSSECKSRCCNTRCKNYFCTNTPQKVRSRPCAKKASLKMESKAMSSNVGPDRKQCFIAEQSQRIAKKQQQQQQQQQKVRRQESVTEKRGAESDRSPSGSSRRSSPTDATAIVLRRYSIAPEFEDPPPPMSAPPLTTKSRRNSSPQSNSGSNKWSPTIALPSSPERRTAKKCKKESSARSMTDESTVWSLDEKARPFSTDGSRVDGLASDWSVSKKKSSKKAMNRELNAKQLLYSDNKNSSEEGHLSDFYAVKKKDKVPPVPASAKKTSPDISTVWTLDGRHRLFAEQRRCSSKEQQQQQRTTTKKSGEDVLTAMVPKRAPGSQTNLWSPDVTSCLSSQVATFRHARKMTSEDDDTTAALLASHRVKRVATDSKPVATLWSSQLSTETSDGGLMTSDVRLGGVKTKTKTTEEKEREEEEEEQRGKARWTKGTAEDQSSLWTMESLTSNHRFPSDKCSICDAKSKGFGIGISTESDESTVWTLDK